MLTPIEIKGISFKSGMGYAKKQVDDFVEDIYDNYEQLYKENLELKDKLSTLNEGIQYYKTIEKTLQKALVLAEKTASETKEAAVLKGESIEKNARMKANMILSDAKNELNHLHLQTVSLAQQYEKYKSQMKQIVTSQLELIESSSFQIDFSGLDAFLQLNDPSFDKSLDESFTKTENLEDQDSDLELKEGIKEEKEENMDVDQTPAFVTKDIAKSLNNILKGIKNDEEQTRVVEQPKIKEESEQPEEIKVQLNKSEEKEIVGKVRERKIFKGDLFSTQDSLEANGVVKRNLLSNNKDEENEDDDPFEFIDNE